ncbi:polysaccharide biosynthesis/export family protein [Loktanella sp. S4079]|uniref:polysaccharide biosynthesis/export family protein n=1 Tax=Loktanella sp. S4079 TaxID=579483 RepID=UPI0005FA653F|nr:polysaccharide biosynthesis/export family protein [Loktanella sp. S4079]KJZ18497.1 hypothetical protein TW80_13755 [Loktanella sp. S4079]
MTIFRRLRNSLICAFLFICPVVAGADTYLLGAEDVVSVRVATWDDATATYVPMQAISGDYTVSAGGMVSLPVVGSVVAAGQSPEELGAAVAERLQMSAGLFQLPAVSLQIIEYRPVYITGDVSNPGSYEWQPGLTATKALALAGGILRAREEAFDEASGFREINLLQSVQVELAQLRARGARLQAELTGTSDIDFPDPIYHPDGTHVVDRIKEDERAIMVMRIESQLRAIESNEALIALYATELASLESKLAGQQRQLELTREQVENLKSLEERGLVPASRLISMEQNLMDQNAEELDLNTAIFRARQRIGETQRDLLQLKDNRRQQIMTELQNTRHEIVLQSKREEMLAGLAAMSGVRPVNTVFVTNMQVRRNDGGSVAVVPVGPDEPILPGDVFEVELALQMSEE